MPDASAQLRLEHVSLKTKLGTYYLLQDLSFAVQRGDRVAIVGPSGAGKTTLLRLLNRLSEASEGKIYFNNQDIQQIPPIALRQQITLVQQESKLLGMTVQQALAYPLVLRGVDAAAIEQRQQACIEQLQIPKDWLNRTEVQLSVGQRQLVAIARALMIQPQVLLLDEPTSALDAGRAAHLMQILTRLAEQQITVLMVNHHLELAAQFASRVLYLSQGRLVHDLPGEKVDWSAIRQELVATEAEQSEEWD